MVLFDVRIKNVLVLIYCYFSEFVQLMLYWGIVYFFWAIRSPLPKCECDRMPMFVGRMAQEDVGHALFLVLRMPRRVVSVCRLLNWAEIHTIFCRAVARKKFGLRQCP